MYCGQDAVCIRLARVCDSVYTICAKAFITCIRVTVLAANVLAAEVFGTLFFTDISYHKTRTSQIICAFLCLRLFAVPRPASFKTWELDCSLFPFSRFKRKGKEAFWTRYSAYPCKQCGVSLRK
jgi:hypothetical protein